MLRGAPTAGVAFIYVSVVYAVLIVLSGCVATTLLLATLHRTFSGALRLSQSVRLGVQLGLGGTFFVLFTRYAGEAALSVVLQSTIGNEASLTPWIPGITVGPFFLGALLNFLVATVVLASLLGGIGMALWYLSVVPWRDRNKDKSQVQPTAWNLAAVTPLVTFLWFILAGVPAVDLWIIVLDLPLMMASACVLPSVLVGFYLLRRRFATHLD
ncbi:hypothetical protein [Halomarina oriensis]|nr:hypothetical protein [Halomarina oriensis]